MNRALDFIKIVKELIALVLLLAALVSSCESKRTANEILDDVAKLRIVVEEVSQKQ